MRGLSTILGAVLALVLVLAQGAAAEERRVYFFGNSLINFPTEGGGTSVPYWLARMAAAGGHGFAADGEWGFLRDFAGRAAPEPNWTIDGVKRAWNGRGDFAAAGWDAIVISPTNFIQYAAPGAAYEGDNPDGLSPLSAILSVIDRQGDVPILIYEGWAEMGGRFPPRAWAYEAYKARNAGEYHEWYLRLVEELQAARPERRIVLLPVAEVLAGLFSEGPLAELGPEALYVDADPHGTPTTYLLAAMVSYAALYGEAPPVGLDMGEEVAPELRRAYPLVALEIAARVGGVLEQGAAARGAAPVAVEEASAGETSAGEAGEPSLAMGLNGISDWSTEQPFIDLMKSARPWLGHEGARWGAWDAKRLEAEGYLDARGWVKAMPRGVDRIESFILTEQDEGARAMAGRYRVRWQGKGVLHIGGRARGTRQQGNEAWFDYTPGAGEVAITLVTIDPDDPIRNIEVVREDQIALHELGVIFNPQWIARIADMRSLRFMDWMMTNGSPVTRWEERPQVGDFSYGWRGVPAEVMIELANFIGADPWFNMPHAADDAYSMRFAELVRDGLDPRLRVYVEYSNELWNFMFPQARWLAERAEARWGRGDDAWMQYGGMRAAEVMRAWGEVFAGEEARLKRVVAVHTGWPGLEAGLLDAPLWQAEEGEGALSPAAHFDAYAVSGYFGFELGDGEEGRLDDLRRWIADSREAAEARPDAQGLERRALDAAIAPFRFDLAVERAAEAVQEGSLRELTGELWPYHAKVARARGLELIMYEGGTHAVGHGEASLDEELAAFFATFNYSGRMGGLYREALARWRAAGGQMFNAFVDVARPSRHGSWGALRHLEDDNPRWQALAADNALPPEAGEARDPGAFDNGVMRRGGEGGDVLKGTPEEDILLGGPGDDRLEARGGSDFIDGGAGQDRAVLPGARQDYRFAMEGARLLAIRGEARTRLRHIEALEFEGEPGKAYRLELPE